MAPHWSGAAGTHFEKVRLQWLYIENLLGFLIVCISAGGGHAPPRERSGYGSFPGADGRADARVAGSELN
jgi:hypothetical protein